MEPDDVLEDLLSWTASPKCSGAVPCATISLSPPPRQQHRASLRESLVNTNGRAKSSASVHHDLLNDENAFSEPLCGTSVNATSPTPSSSMLPIPPLLEERLFPHQREGVQWLYHRHCKSRACLLADEMGLGKTVQVVVFLERLYALHRIKTTILVVPPTLIPVWVAAFAEWGNGDPSKQLSGIVEVIHNEPRKKRQARWRKLRYGLPCVLLTTYGVLRQDATDMSATLVDYVVLDEAHLIKDASTCVFKSAMTLAARHKIALTGTPLMNTFDDMWSVFRFLDGSILDVERSNFNKVSATLLRGNERDASSEQREAASSELAKLQAAIRPFMLRREKKDVAGAVLCSNKQDIVVWVSLTDVQQRLYAAFLESKEATSARDASADVDADLTEGVIAEEAACGATDEDPSDNRGVASSSPLLLLTVLAQICNHPWLNLVDEAFNAALTLSPYIPPVEDMGDIFGGAKLWVALQLLVRCIREHRKSLVFSRSKRLLHLLSFLLKDWGIAHTQVDGDTPADRRCSEVDRFNSSTEIWVCLLTTQVGGVGLTFTAASAVILLNPSYNPSADAQAVDRVHRIGQQRDVIVFRLVTCGTVEEKVYRNQIFKRMAALQSTQGSNGGWKGMESSSSSTPSQIDGELYRYFTSVQLRNMFVMDDVYRSSTAEQLEELHPGHVDSLLRNDICLIEGVCDVSDNGIVLVEAVSADRIHSAAAMAPFRGATTSPEPTQSASLISRSPPPSSHHSCPPSVGSHSPNFHSAPQVRIRSSSADLQEEDLGAPRLRIEPSGPPSSCLVPALTEHVRMTSPVEVPRDPAVEKGDQNETSGSFLTQQVSSSYFLTPDRVTTAGATLLSLRPKQVSDNSVALFSTVSTRSEEVVKGKVESVRVQQDSNLDRHDAIESPTLDIPHHPFEASEERCAAMRSACERDAWRTPVDVMVPRGTSILAAIGKSVSGPQEIVNTVAEVDSDGYSSAGFASCRSSF